MAIFCGSCGKQNQDGDTFCSGCGSKLIKLPKTESIPDPKPPVMDAPRPIQPIATAPVTKPPVPDIPVKKPDKPGGKGKKTGLIILLVLLIAAAVGIGIYLAGRDDGGSKSGSRSEREKEDKTEKQSSNGKKGNQVVVIGNLAMNLKGQKRTLDYTALRTWVMPEYDGVLCLSEDKALYVIDSNLKETQLEHGFREVKSSQGIYPIVVSSKGIIAYYNDYTLYVYDAVKGKRLAEYEDVEPNFALSPDGSVLAFWDGDEVHLCNTGSVGSTKISFEPDGRFEKMISVSNDKKYVYYTVKASEGSSLRVWSDGNEERTVMSYGVDMNQNGLFLISSDSKQILYDVNSTYYRIASEGWQASGFSSNSPITYVGETYQNGLYASTIDQPTFDGTVFLPGFLVYDIENDYTDVFMDTSQMILSEDKKSLAYVMSGNLCVVDLYADTDREVLMNKNNIVEVTASKDLKRFFVTTDDDILYHVDAGGERTTITKDKTQSGIGFEVYDDYNDRYLFINDRRLYSVSAKDKSLQQIEEVGNRVDWMFKSREGIFCFTEKSEVYYIDGKKVTLMADKIKINIEQVAKDIYHLNNSIFN